MKTLILTLALLFSFCQSSYALEKVYTIHGNFSNAIKKLKQMDASDENPTVPPLLREYDIKITGLALPKQGYFKGEVKLLESVYLKPFLNIAIVDAFEKRIELWRISDNEIRIRAYVNIELRRSRFPFRWLNLIKNAEVSNIECEILDVEESKLREFLENTP